MHVTFNRYEGIDRNRIDDVVKKVDESLMPRLSELPGFGGYYLIEAGNGVLNSIGFFDTQAQSAEFTRVAATWIREEKLESTLPNPPKVTNGEVLVQRTSELVPA